MFSRGLIAIVSVACMVFILFELTMDSTCAFVRVSTASQTFNRTSCSQALGRVSNLKDSSNEYSDCAGSESSTGHSASIATTTSFEPNLENKLFELASWLIPHAPDAFVILRPPIA